MACPCKIQKDLIKTSHVFDPVRETYLDYNATTAPDRALLALYQNLSLSHWGHPMSPHGAGSSAYEIETLARKRIGEYFDLDDSCFFQVNSGTEGIYWAIHLLHKELNNAVFYLSKGCHPCVEQALNEQDIDFTLLDIDSQGQTILPDLELTSIPIVIYSPVNHETGGIDCCSQIYDWATQKGGLVLADAVQALARLNEKEWLMYCHLFVISGHKIHTPKGVALVGGSWIKNHQDNLPHLGTNPVLLRVLSEGLYLHKSRRLEMNDQLSMQTKEIQSMWQNDNLPLVNLTPDHHVPGVLLLGLSIPCDMEKLFMFMAKHRISLSRFCACQGTIKGESTILKEMGVNNDLANQSLRLSGGYKTKRGDWLNFTSALKRFL
ncbi:aminotransferase class V-fold PLP-dependent enzyme [Spirochaeta cellobiosiphila]|uniref:aminotransferase class V-fold PLP-dependent enzyme n=1 Tax=Spirochaeta cellobiosiphila TaxID=504483 RepID=UPI00040C0F65|nr:aminotransferase class V-fold PLP-dependent enzyme [Spirochaeta cellobiosiphila]